MSGSSCLVVGFNLASSIGCKLVVQFLIRADCLIQFDSGSTIPTILLIAMGCIVLFCGGIYEVNTKREALFPPVAFKDLSIGKRHHCVTGDIL